MAEGNNPTLFTDSSSETDSERFFEETDTMNPEMSNASTGEDAALQRFLQQQRSDLMFELRRIQHGERPVTGQNNRDNIASFMAKHVQEPAAGASNNFKNIPANVDSVEEHRPEAVVVEVQGVVEQRRVSSMLQSSNFRRHLENIIRGSISTARQSTRQAISRRPRVANPPQPAMPEASAAHQSILQAISRRPRVANPPQPAMPEALQEPVNSSPAHVAAPAVVQPSARVLNSLPGVQDQIPAAVDPAPGEAEQNTERRVWDSISQVQHEEMVYEISELLHRRLVSSALGSEFRTVMELHVEDHLSRTGTDGEAVADFVRNIPQSQLHIPNDFSHLGIIPGPRDDNSDNISITGISATAVPYTQTNRHLNQELQSLKSQMEEMKNMMRLSFDLQMDIQRAIRQEVAAALASALGQGATAAAAAPEVRSTPVNDTHCLICLDSYSDSVLYQCGHMCVCFACGKNLITRGNGKCPVCRAPIKDVIRAYKTNME